MKDPAKRWSLRQRLTRRVLGFVIGAWLATIALSAAVLNHEMNEMFDEELHALIETTVLFLDSATAGPIPRSYGVETNDGERVLRILSPEQRPQSPWPALADDGFHDTDGWRILRRSADGVVIEAGQSTALRREEVLEAASALLLLAFPLIGLLLWSLRRSVVEATRPFATLAADVGQRRPDDLSPVEASGLPTEVQPLATAFDGYLARIGTLRQAERDFAANAAHELRTPLASLRGRLNLSTDPDARSAIATVDALTRRIERLLQLARLEAGVAIERGPSDLIRILHLLLDDLRPRLRHGLHFDDGDLSSLPVAADADATAILLRNILENAVEHGSGEVRVTLSGTGHLIIQNPTGRTMLPQARFDRGSTSAGQGLGLSIIDALAKAMGVQLRRSQAQGILRYDLTFPLADRDG